MLRIMPKLKGFRPWASILLPHSQICSETTGILQPAPPTIDTSEFVTETQPQPLPVLRQHQLVTKWTTREYLQGDSQRINVMLPEEMEQHRLLVMDRLDQNKLRRRGNSHALIVTGAPEVRGYPFRQHSEFLYLCDCLVPDVVLLLLRTRQFKLHTILFLPLEEHTTDPELSRLACQRFNVNEVVSKSRLRSTLSAKLSHVSNKLWYSQNDSPLSQLICELAEQNKLAIECPSHILEYVRSFKTPSELAAIRHANCIAAQSLQELIAEHEPHLSQRQLGVLFAHKCRERYAHQALPYEPQLALGVGGAWLMDAACQYAGYYGGLGRYWPINGRFTPPQKVLYNILLEIRNKLCDLIRGTHSIVHTARELQAAYLIMLAEQLRDLRVLPNDMMSAPDFNKILGRFNCFPTLVRHVGLDFVDSGEQLLNCPLLPGNVILLQLSIFIPNDCLQAYPEFRGVLCILKDCIHIVGNQELELLSSDCVSSSRDVEDLRYSKKRKGSKCFAY